MSKNIDIKDFFIPNDIYHTMNSNVSNNKHPNLTEKELQLINKFRSLTAEKRKAIEILFGIKDNKL